MLIPCVCFFNRDTFRKLITNQIIHYYHSKEKYEQQSGGNAAYGGGGYGDQRNPAFTRATSPSLTATGNTIGGKTCVRETFDDLQADAHPPPTVKIIDLRPRQILHPFLLLLLGGSSTKSRLQRAVAIISGPVMGPGGPSLGGGFSVSCSHLTNSTFTPSSNLALSRDVDMCNILQLKT